ncbi:hypothetical protein HFD88_009308 [Aspergillus terreus]|nr:hypothetical protein HFD88_009308 [Aspergillus terreus]
MSYVNPQYAIARPSEYLMLTGAGIQDIQLCKKAICGRISVTPFDFSLNLQAMTVEKLQFSLPAVFTIGHEDQEEALRKYAKLLSGNSQDVDIVIGIIEGETRVIVSTMSMEEVFKERQVFKTKVIENVQNELHQFGLKIYNANVKELQDAPGSEYFAFLSRKAHEGASNQAKIDVAEARMRGEIGEAEKQGRTKQEISKIDADTAVLETKRKAEQAKADSELMNRQTELNQTVELGKIIAKREVESRDAELQKKVESKRAETELERLRAQQVIKSKVDREAAEETANGAFHTAQKEADGRLYKEKLEADGAYYRQSKAADAALYKQQREAEGIFEIAKAYGALIDVLGGPQAFLQFRMLETGMYEKMAKANGQALQGLQPKITSWNTGGSANGSSDSMAPVRNIMQSLPPLLDTIHEQTGISPPSWLAQIPGEKHDNLVRGAPAK